MTFYILFLKDVAFQRIKQIITHVWILLPEPMNSEFNHRHTPLEIFFEFLIIRNCKHVVSFYQLKHDFQFVVSGIMKDLN